MRDASSVTSLPRIRVIVGSGETSAALKPSISCTGRGNLAILNLDVGVGVRRHSFVATASRGPDLRGVSRLSIH